MLFSSPDPADILRPTDLFTPLELAFAGFLARMTHDHRHEFVSAAALAARQSRAGDICLDLARPPHEVRQPLALAGIDIPRPESWREILNTNASVGAPGERRPLILNGPRLYLQKYHEDEEFVRQSLVRLAAGEISGLDAANLSRLLAQIFSDHGSGETDWQKVAAFVAATRRLCVITGGPGTGKTTTVAGLLALIAGLHADDNLVMALAAPTGKAADRLTASIAGLKSKTALDPGLAALLPDRAMTLHRLLGIHGLTGVPLYGPKNPLPVDVLVVDEASMLDLPLAAKTLRALGPQARLILVGDQNQLFSVAPGAVLGDICGPERAARSFSPQWHELWKKITATRLPEAECSDMSACLTDAVVGLQKTYRFSARSGIMAAGTAVRQGDFPALVRALSEGEDLEWIDPMDHDFDSTRFSARLAHEIISGYGPLVRAKTTDEAFAALSGFTLLAPMHRGRLGVQALNATSERVLARAGLLDIQGEWYPGRPLMVLQNSYETGLFNGDMGMVALRQNRIRAVFPGRASQDGVREFFPGHLPEVATAFAMTVHKSQGSEFERMVLVLPDQDHPGLTREMLYTALTRARRSLLLVAGRAVLSRILSRRTQRDTGLRQGLWGESCSAG
jgi:exodeoxyribonuclease V alpha subunit